MKHDTYKWAFSGIVAALYVVLGYAFQPISFLAIQVRVADALVLLVTIEGLPCAIGLSFGIFFVNLSSPLGVMDLISVPISFILMLPMAGIHFRDGPVHNTRLWGGLIYTTGIAAWVACMLYVAYGVPWVIDFLVIWIGLAIAVFGIGYPVYRTWLEVIARRWTRGMEDPVAAARVVIRSLKQEYWRIYWIYIQLRFWLFLLGNSAYEALEGISFKPYDYQEASTTALLAKIKLKFPTIGAKFEHQIMKRRELDGRIWELITKVEEKRIKDLNAKQRGRRV